MPLRLDSAQSDFEQRFSDLLGAKRESSKDVNDTVASIISDVRARGDEAVAELTNRFDRASVTPSTLAFSADEIAEAAARVPG
ncbi:MAG: histidinol dehydrogenase, partial [Rhodospirillaceae bacterium]